MNARNYPAERIERYMAALAEADVYALVERRDDRERYARAVMAVADAETDPVYKSGYDTGRMHARRHAAAEAYPGQLAMLSGLVATLRAVAEHGGIDEVRQLLAEHQRDEREAYAEAEGKSSRLAAEATPEPEPYTGSETAFMQIGTAHWPRRAVLHLEGLPPLVGTYNGAGMRRIDHHDGLIVEPMLAFADRPATTGKDGAL